jgi:hypothetical protein
MAGNFTPDHKENYMKDAEIEPIVVKENGDIEKSKFDHSTVSLETLVGRIERDYDLDPPYQRQACYDTEQQAEIIKAIAYNICIGHVTLAVLPSDYRHKNVVDAKQRLLAILNFFLNRFRVPFIIKGDKRWLCWNDIKKDESLVHIRQRFEDYQMAVLTYNDLDLLGQSSLFGKVNTSVPLSVEERLYSRYHYAKALYRYVWTKCLKGLLKHCRDNAEQHNKQDKGSIFANRICFICFGPKFDDAWAVRELSISTTSNKTSALVKDVKELDEIIIRDIERNKVYTITDNYVETLPMFPKMENLKKVCDALISILECENTVSKKINKNDLLDIIMFMMKKMQDKIITLAMLKQQKKEFFKVFKDYIIAKSEKGSRLTGQSTSTTRINERIQLFEECFQKSGIDGGYKNASVPAMEVTKALLNSPAKCPIKGDCLSDRNTQIDHVRDKSKHSSTRYVAISADANQQKSNVDEETTNSLGDYYVKYGDVG